MAPERAHPAGHSAPAPAAAMTVLASSPLALVSVGTVAQAWYQSNPSCNDWHAEGLPLTHAG